MMSRFGAIMQTGFVVRDVHKAMHHWTTTLGVGPFWLTERVVFKEITYRGAPSAIEMAVAIAFTGDLQIELIQPLSDAPSIYRDHLAAFGEGLQHLGVLAEKYDDALAAAAAAEIATLQAGSVASGLRFAYLDTAGPLPGTMLELIEATPGMLTFLDRLKQSARSWHGKDAVRKL